MPLLDHVAIRVSDLDRAIKFYSNAGGIQVLWKLARGSFVAVPPDQIRAAEDLMARAVDIALGSLVKKPVPTQVPKPEALESEASK